jgi:hypothetical protein
MAITMVYDRLQEKKVLVFFDSILFYKQALPQNFNPDRRDMVLFLQV